jgi:hypothetical protein
MRGVPAFAHDQRLTKVLERFFLVAGQDDPVQSIRRRGKRSDSAKQSWTCLNPVKIRDSVSLKIKGPVSDFFTFSTWR